MRKFSRLWTAVFILITIFAATGTAYGSVWPFDGDGDGAHHFTPRGFLVDTATGQHWLSSGYNNSGSIIRYTGVRNGVDYLEAKQEDGSNYTFYAMTHRNPSPGKTYLAVYKNNSRIELGPYTGTPKRATEVDPSGNNTCYIIPINNFELEPGCLYEFIFLRGMTAGNQNTYVLAPGEKDGYYKGYINKNDMTGEEQAIYDREKNNEYQFVESYAKDSESGEFKVNLIPMRFSVQTYADLEIWGKAADKAQEFLDTVSERDLQQGKYKRENIKMLKTLLKEYNEEAEESVKEMLQPEANRKMRVMKEDLEEALKKAQSEKPEPSDLSTLKKKIEEAQRLYDRASKNVGIDAGQYNEIEVDALKEEIRKARKLDKYSPQSIVDAEVRALEDAMTAVKASRSQEGMLQFYDKVTGIYVLVPETALPKDSSLMVIRVGTGEEEYRAMKQNLDEEQTEAILYNLQFYQKEKKVYPSKKAEVHMPIDDSISAKSSVIYSVGKGGKLTEIPSVRAAGVQKFRTKALGNLAMAGAAATEAEKAEARAEKTTDIMNKTKQKKAKEKVNKLKKDQKQKEEFKDPIDQLLKRNENLATFSKDVKQETNPVYLIILAVLIGITAVAAGVRAVLRGKDR